MIFRYAVVLLMFMLVGCAASGPGRYQILSDPSGEGRYAVFDSATGTVWQRGPDGTGGWQWKKIESPATSRDAWMK